MSFVEAHNRMGAALIEHGRGDYAEDHFIAAYKVAVLDDGIETSLICIFI